MGSTDDRFQNLLLMLALFPEHVDGTTQVMKEVEGQPTRYSDFYRSTMSLLDSNAWTLFPPAGTLTQRMNHFDVCDHLPSHAATLIMMDVA